jgi:putative flippase GtrA
LRRFLVVGTLAVLVDGSVYYALAAGLNFGTSIAKAVSYLAGVAVGFLLNKRWTFASARPAPGEAATYLALYAVTLGVNVVCNRAMLALVGVEWSALAFLVATGVTTALNFLGMRLVTFRKGINERLEQQCDPHPLAATP